MLAEAGIWGSIRHHGLPASSGSATTPSAGYTQNAAENSMPATPRQARKVEIVRDLVWRFYRPLKSIRQSARPSLPLHSTNASRKSSRCTPAIKTSISFWRVFLADRTNCSRCWNGRDTPRHTNGLGERPAQLRHQAKDLRRHDEPRWPRRTRHHAEADEDLQKARPAGVAVSRRSHRSPRLFRRWPHSSRPKASCPPDDRLGSINRTSASPPMVHIATGFAHQHGAATNLPRLPRLPPEISILGYC